MSGIKDKRSWLLAVILLLLAGCGAPPVKRPPPPPDPLVLQQVDALEGQGEFLDAADRLQQLAAGQESPSRETLLLRAADNLLRAGKTEDAERLLSGITPGRQPGLDFYAQVLRAELALAKGAPREALERLQAAPPSQVPDGLRQRRYSARAEAYRQLGQPLEGARELAELDLAMSDPEGRVANQVTLLRLLLGMDGAALQRSRTRHGALLAGWIDLALALQRGEGRRDGAAAVQQWRERNPSHPLLPETLSTLQQGRGVAPGGGVAVLLPQSGPLREVGGALQDGIMAAYQQQPANARPQLAFLDSNSDDVLNLYQRAVQSGAQLVIGPLERTAVARLAGAPLSVPVLALNQLPQGSAAPPKFYQFALAPEDEAIQVAERAWADGHSRALVLGSTGEWGERIHQAFRQRWQALGGTIADYRGYDDQQRDFSDTVRALLRLEESVDRRAEVQRLLGKRVAFEPQPRQDADFLFLIAKSEVARAIRPQLQYFYAGNLPVYATSHIYSGTPDAQRDQDLGGVMFPDLPWLLDPQAGGNLSQQSLAPLLAGGGVERRLYAMGMDSLGLIGELARLEASPGREYPGLTGALTLDGERKIRRRLAWAQYRQGLPQALEATPSVAGRPAPAFGAPALGTPAGPALGTPGAPPPPSRGIMTPAGSLVR
jgi:uncharacterized protein